MSEPKTDHKEGFNPLMPQISLLKWRISEEEQERINKVLGVPDMEKVIRTGLQKFPQG